jgi:iron complex transport system substrate-binding protein
MKTHRVLLATLLLVSTVSLAACGAATPAPTARPTSITVADDIGSAVEVVGTVERIVSLAPSNTEIAFALGLGDRLVGVTEFCDYPPEALAIEKIGGLEANVEQVVSLDPDLVLAIGGEPVSPVVEQLRGLGLTALVLAPDGLEGIYHDIELIGQVAGVPERAAELVARMQERVAAVTALTANVTERPLVFYELDATDPAKPWTGGAGSWHDQFIQMAGGENLAGDQPNAWVQLNAEEIVERNPDIIMLGDANWGVSVESVAQRPGWEVIAAVQNGKVFPIDDNLISRPGPRVVDGLEALARLIHPELFE